MNCRFAPIDACTDRAMRLLVCKGAQIRTALQHSPGEGSSRSS